MKNNGDGLYGRHFGPGTLLIAFLAGGIIGAGAALLWAPQSGKETRKFIRDSSGEIVKKGGALYGQARDWGADWIHRGQRFEEEEKDFVAGAIGAFKDRVRKAGAEA